MCTGLLTLVLSSPHLRTLIPENAVPVAATGAVETTLFTFSIRSFTMAEILVKSAYPDRGWLIQLVNALFLPLNYFLEFGFYFLVGCMVLKRYCRLRRISREQVALATLLGTSVVVCTFVRSSVIAFNDLGWRGILFAQFVLILWAVELWPSWATVERNTTIYQGVMLRVFPILVDSGAVAKHEWISRDRQLGRRTMALRRAYSELEIRLPFDAILQVNPSNEPGTYIYGNYSRWQTVAFGANCGWEFGGTRKQCDEVLSGILTIFANPAKPSSSQTEHITALVFQDTDPVWHDGNSWIWQTEPILANRFARIMPAAPDKGAIRGDANPK
jgi:hypothetical protein